MRREAIARLTRWCLRYPRGTEAQAIAALDAAMPNVPIHWLRFLAALRRETGTADWAALSKYLRDRADDLVTPRDVSATAEAVTL